MNEALALITDPARQGNASASLAPALLVMLPGAYDAPRHFIQHGFVEAVRERQLDVDVQLVDAHVAYYTGQTIVTRLREDVIEPAWRQGYGQVWLLGISIGGMGSLAYAATYPLDVTGVVAMAPYLGPRNISADVVRAGGLRSWPASNQTLPDDEVDRRLWCWLKAHAEAGLADDGQPLPLLYWAHGDGDRFALGHKAVAKALPPDRVLTVGGGHDWPTWAALWDQVLDRLPLPRLAGSSPAWRED